jgi:replication factor C small subunit
VAEKNLPHLLFVGPAGIGKTSSILALARDLYGSGYQNYILELNASDERGINIIREKVKNFARTAALASPVNFKILIMDEADHLTSDAQHALRRTMEIYTRTCRFCLIGNYSENIIDPIQSRCSVFRFIPLKDENVEDYLFKIVKNENLELSKEGFYALYNASEGDLRKATNLLQAAAASGKRIDDTSIYEVLGSVRPDTVRKMLESALHGSFIESRELLRDLLINKGIAPEDIVRISYREIMKHPQITEVNKVAISDKLGEVDYRLTQGSRPEIQISTLLAYLTIVGEKGK